MTLVKICGITNLNDARHAIECGADALGFNFYRESARYIDPEQAKTVIDQLPGGARLIGVFVDEDIDAVIDIASACNLNGVQLHGDENAAYLKELRVRSGLPVIKAFRAGPGFTLDAVLASGANAVLLDAHAKDLNGGTGKITDWHLAAKMRSIVGKLYLAGGLSAENVADAIAAVRPYAVDACSLLESEPGRKDHEKVARFVAAAKAIKLYEL